MGAAVGMMLLRATQRRSHQKLEEAEGPPLEPLEKVRAAATWTSDFWLQNCERIGFCCFIHFVVKCYGSPRKQIQACIRH